MQPTKRIWTLSQVVKSLLACRLALNLTLVNDHSHNDHLDPKKLQIWQVLIMLTRLISAEEVYNGIGSGSLGRAEAYYS